MPTRILPFSTKRTSRLLGTVHSDGSITCAGITYASIRDVPPECQAFRADLAAYVRWKAMYRAIDPRRRRPGR